MRETAARCLATVQGVAARYRVDGTEWFRSADVQFSAVSTHDTTRRYKFTSTSDLYILVGENVVQNPVSANLELNHEDVAAMETALTETLFNLLQEYVDKA